MKVYQLRRMLDFMKPNQEIYIDVPDEPNLFAISKDWYRNTDENNDPIVAIRLIPNQYEE